mmetsp:Transcript_578/g.693  ORF Transcript_578/g.693 Transcript_578/m.693 type:complete len:456 (-) Transcript_578:1016-2383(-)|eukprot:CAMPEP_0204881450 /NCGR_PEP_ID=MMETSP1349-20130617/2697_1 /ASSEMBLY_ACC=CAM_ASM_000710 /TAXON_ID=215587 /ORGANISM="Aplanochytrium stocchinoi, Strain GSBS06" /LENGTH=455 /DNA_ID=CAMNT_0052040389 /DNA_START=9 /DNA_END=1376 /DNA_ORIENTATION=-
MSLPGQTSLKEHDPELYALIQKESERQRCGLELIASENFTSRAVMECLGSCLTNKYAEGIPGKRYYGGNEYIDQIETLCQKRALEAYGLSPEEWGVNVQPYSGSPANFAVYTALIKPHDRIMGLDLPSGGHLTHGFYTLNKKTNEKKSISATSVYFESMPYRVNETTGIIDYDTLQANASLFKPNMLVCGGSAYPREWDYARFRQIADENGALLLCDMAHISGLVATGVVDSPFEYADVVTTTTHKSLRGPRSGMIFFRKDERKFEEKINWAVFPALQGGPHEHQIAGVATQLKEVCSDEFKVYAKQVVTNCQALAAKLVANGHKLATGGTDNHLILWDLRPHGLTGSKVELLCDAVHITLNKNAVCGDKSALSPGGVRIGTPALTTRGFKEADFEKVGEFLHRAVEICLDIQKTNGKKLIDFQKGFENNKAIAALEADVTKFASSFPMPGIEFK